MKEINHKTFNIGLKHKFMMKINKNIQLKCNLRLKML